MWEYSYAYSDHLEHHGILGQKWGVRRFQNPDGTLTPEGKKRYKINSEGQIVKKTRSEKKYDNDIDTYGRQLGQLNLAINKAQYLARQAYNNFDIEEGIRYEYGMQLQAESLYQDIYNKIIKKYGKDAFKDIENNEQFKKYMSEANEWYDKNLKSIGR